MATMKEIADAAGVSQATVSRVLNDGPKVGRATRERVKSIIKELNYRPNANARALANSRSDAVGVVIADLYEPFFAALAHGVETVARKHDTQILISGGSIGLEHEQKAIGTLLSHRCDAMVVHSKSLPDGQLIELAREVPGMVLINRFIPEIASRCVWLDNQAGGRLMAEYMIRQGHTKLAVISSDFPIDDPLHRIAGIQEALAAANIDLPEVNIEYGPPNQEGGEAAVQNLMSKGADFTAVLAYNDAMAAGAMAMLLDHGFDVPREVSVIGYDDILLAKYCRPKLTTLRYPIEMMASKATELALQYAQGILPSEDTTYKYQPTIVKRDSVRKI
ncbi:substrate-binding domain-containing protein [Alteromonas sp. ASW11-36]|uniref:Substrate-binding domain-containing protein n=1 Tax=Alteromonas arenosi TaxID=3055817 RepID=A0ABT7SUI8_9ALTE|nr:substrate-binding domain-containing protein [Alteromonas sp. ASW11-36]MDM7859217.1 substrate-binding domain-containing protein [Alteromonas sp. ASW11-36]